MDTADKNARRIILWLLIFVYFTFAYNYGAKLSTLVYTDFPSFYYGAKLAFINHHSPYDHHALKDAVFADSPLKPGEPPPTIYPYLYPPPSLLLFYPMTRMHAETAKVALLAMNHLCLLAVVGMMMVPIAGFKPRELLTLLPAFLMLYMLLSKGAFNTIELGQVNLIVLALLCLSWWGLKHDWPQWAIALPLGIAAIFKIYPVIFLALLFFRRKYLAMALTVAVLLVFGAISWLVLPKSLWHQWTHDVVRNSGYLQKPQDIFSPAISQNIGLAGFMSRLFLPPELFKGHVLGNAIFPHRQVGIKLTYAMVAVITLITIGAAFVSTRKAAMLPAERGRRINLEFSVFLILTFLVAPLAWEHHLAYVMPAIVVALLVVLRDRPSESMAPWTPPLLLLIACILGWPLTIGKLPLPRIVQILAVSLKLYAVVALWMFLLKQLLTGDGTAQTPRDLLCLDPPP